MQLRSSNKNIEEEEEGETKIEYEYLPDGTRLSSWQYYDHPMTQNMKNYILETISDRLDQVILDGSEENINIRISLNPNEKVASTFSIRGVLCNKRKRLYTPLHLDSITDLIHN